MDDVILDMTKDIAEVKGMVKNLHASLYENGFKDDIKTIQHWIKDYVERDREATCPYMKDKQERKEANRWRWRRSEILTGVFGFVIAAIVAWGHLGG